MTTDILILTFLLFLLISTLYSSIGHAGASGYLAIMALLSFAPEAIKPTSLVLNIIVATIASVRFIRAGYFDRRIFLGFVVTSIPLAFVGGYITVGPEYFKLMAGVFLVISSVILLIRAWIKPFQKEPRPLPLAAGLGIGSVIGLFSGLIGVGGGIFLSPIMIMANWTTVKKASGIAALFILFNSVAGLAGHLTAIRHIDYNIGYWVVAVIIGGLTGSWLGTIKFNNKIIITFLFLVLLSAGLKFILVDFTL